MADARTLFVEVAKHPERYYLIHYSSQSLFDSDHVNLSPRITSVVVMHFESSQTVSFALHAVAESLGIPKEEIENRYDEIERELLKRFYNFARDRREKYWIHWNMRNLTFGFEHLEHRYRVLSGEDSPSIPVEVRINLNDALKDRYGHDYAPDPKMINLMKQNGEVSPKFLIGADEAQAFQQNEFIRMNASTISKVAFFSHVIKMTIKGRLKTAGSGFGVFVDRLLESRSSRFIALAATLLGTAIGIWGLIVTLTPH